MSDFDEEPEEEEGDVPKGALGPFIRMLNEEQRKAWTLVRKQWKAEVRIAKQASGRSTRDDLHDAFQRVQGKITADKIERLIDNAVNKGDAQALRVMAQMAGMDLSDRPAQAAGEGARVVIVRPHPMLLTPEEEANVQAQIEQV